MICLNFFSFFKGTAFEDMVGDAVVPPTIDPHCALDMPSGACQPSKYFYYNWNFYYR